MIFATVGTQLPFDRLIRALDEWARDHAHSEVFAQIGQTTYQPKHMQWSRTITPDQFQSYVAESDVVVAHAGMGTIISAIELGKRVVVMPRREALGITTTRLPNSTAEMMVPMPACATTVLHLSSLS